MYKILRIVDDNLNFLVLEVQNITTDEKEITYVNIPVDLGKELYDKKELQLL